MWLSEKAAQGTREPEPCAEIGVVTSGGARPSVMLDGEKRAVELLSPGGVFWAPAEGEQVVITRCGGELFVSGSLRGNAALRPGELCLDSGGGRIFLRPDGNIELAGTVNVKGLLLLNGVDIRKMMGI